MLYTHVCYVLVNNILHIYIAWINEQHVIATFSLNTATTHIHCIPHTWLIMWFIWCMSLCTHMHYVYLQLTDLRCMILIQSCKDNGKECSSLSVKKNPCYIQYQDGKMVWWKMPGSWGRGIGGMLQGIGTAGRHFWRRPWLKRGFCANDDDDDDDIQYL